MSEAPKFVLSKGTVYGEFRTLNASGDRAIPSVKLDALDGEGPGPICAIDAGDCADSRALAYLFAAAPELYASLVEVLDVFAPYAEDWEPDSVGHEILRVARAALAKASGTEAQ